MKLIKYNNEMTKQRINAFPTVSLHPNGRIYLNKKLAEIFGAEHGNTFCFFQNEEALHEWYVAKAKSKDDNGLHATVKIKCGGAAIVSKPVCNKLLASVDMDCGGIVKFRTAKEPIQEDGYDLYTIFTSKNLNEKE